MRILAIDPGSEESAYVRMCDNKPETWAKEPNDNMLTIVHEFEFQHLAIEMVACYGMPVGKTVFDTCYWIGRFAQCAFERGIPVTLIYRADIKKHICHNAHAKDSNVRQALIDRFRDPGTKKNPGLLYGMKADEWSALAVAVTFCDRMNEGGSDPVCKTCNDTHIMSIEGRGDYMCTRCPVPCEECRKDGRGGRGAFCSTTPCDCKCHKE